MTRDGDDKQGSLSRARTLRHANSTRLSRLMCLPRPQPSRQSPRLSKTCIDPASMRCRRVFITASTAVIAILPRVHARLTQCWCRGRQLHLASDKVDRGTGSQAHSSTKPSVAPCQRLSASISPTTTDYPNRFQHNGYHPQARPWRRENAFLASQPGKETTVTSSAPSEVAHKSLSRREMPPPNKKQGTQCSSHVLMDTTIQSAP